MATGDLKNNLSRLQAELNRTKYPHEVDYLSLIQGAPAAYLPIYNYLLTEYSVQVAAKIADLKISLTTCTDRNFVDGIYKVFRELFSYRPTLNKEQFFSTSFSERKVIMAIDVSKFVQKLDNELAPKKQSLAWARYHRSTSPALGRSKQGGDGHRTRSPTTGRSVSPLVVNETRRPITARAQSECSTQHGCGRSHSPVHRLTQSMRPVRPGSPAAQRRLAESVAVHSSQPQSGKSSSNTEIIASEEVIEPHMTEVPIRGVVVKHTSAPQAFTDNSQLLAITQTISDLESRLAVSEQGRLALQQRVAQLEQRDSDVNASSVLENALARITLAEQRLHTLEHRIGEAIDHLEKSQNAGAKSSGKNDFSQLDFPSNPRSKSADTVVAKSLSLIQPYKASTSSSNSTVPVAPSHISLQQESAIQNPLKSKSSEVLLGEAETEVGTPTNDSRNNSSAPLSNDGYAEVIAAALNSSNADGKALVENDCLTRLLKSDDVTVQEMTPWNTPSLCVGREPDELGEQAHRIYAMMKDTRQLFDSRSTTVGATETDVSGPSKPDESNHVTKTPPPTLDWSQHTSPGEYSFQKYTDSAV